MSGLPLQSIAGPYTFVMNTLKDSSGRSSFNKSFQYILRLLSIEILEHDSKSVLGKDLLGASGAVNTSRKIFNLGGWMDQFVAVSNSKWSSQRDILKTLATLFNGSYLFFDNINVLNRIKIMSTLNDGRASKYAMFSFWMSQLLSLIVEILDHQQELKKGVLSKDEVKSKQLWFAAQVIMRLCNLTYSANGWQLPLLLFGRQFSDKTCAIAGLTSGVLALSKAAVKANTKKVD